MNAWTRASSSSSPSSTAIRSASSAGRDEHATASRLPSRSPLRRAVAPPAAGRWYGELLDAGASVVGPSEDDQSAGLTEEARRTGRRRGTVGGPSPSARAAAGPARSDRRPRGWRRPPARDRPPPGCADTCGQSSAARAWWAARRDRRPRTRAAPGSGCAKSAGPAPAPPGSARRSRRGAPTTPPGSTSSAWRASRSAATCAVAGVSSASEARSASGSRHPDPRGWSGRPGSSSKMGLRVLDGSTSGPVHSKA